MWADLARAVELLRTTRLKRVLAAPGAILQIGGPPVTPVAD
jgi:hypothetical protein